MNGLHQKSMELPPSLALFELLCLPRLASDDQPHFLPLFVLAQVTISNDGAEIMKLLDIVHPAAKTLVDIARSQDAEIGDGTTTVVLLAGELLRASKAFVEEGVHAQVIIRVRVPSPLSSFLPLLTTSPSFSSPGLATCAPSGPGAIGGIGGWTGQHGG